MHATVGHQSIKVKIRSMFLTVINRCKEFFFLKEIPIFDRFCDAGQILIHHSAGSHIQMPDFRISHLSVRQSYSQTTRITFHKRPCLHQLIDRRSICCCDGISIYFIGQSKAVQYHKYDRFSHNYLIFFPSCSTKLISLKRRIFVCFSDFRTRMMSSFSRMISLSPSNDTIFF